MEKFIPESYNTVINLLQPVIEKYDLDKITVESLIRSSIEVDEQEIQPVTAVWKSKKGVVYSTKASNIKVNLKFALSSLFRLKTTLSQKDIWLGLAIIYLIVDLFTSATKEIDELSAVVLVSVYRLQSGNNERIKQYAKEICPAPLSDKLQFENVDESLQKLESWGCISCEDGNYMVNEKVMTSMIKEAK